MLTKKREKRFFARLVCQMRQGEKSATRSEKKKETPLLASSC